MHKENRTGCRLSVYRRITAVAVALVLLYSIVPIKTFALVYVGGNSIPHSIVLYWDGTHFYSDEACSVANVISDSLGVPITRLPALMSAIDGATTVYMKTAYTVSGNETIDGDTHDVKLIRHSSNTGNTLITVPNVASPNQASLTLSNITIDGNNIQAANTAVLVESGGTLIINTGIVIQNNNININTGNTSLVGGGGIRVCGTAIMNDGYIQNNNAKYGGSSFGFGGGGVAIVGGSFTMKDGSINNNTALNSGSTGPGGGGVLLKNNAGFIMEGGIIKNNQGMYGGAVYNYGTTVTINGGTISDNTATKSCGGIYCAGSNNLTVNGGLITRNKCLSDSDSNGLGGAINVNSGVLRITGGSIIDNSSARGDAIFIQSSRTVYITGGTINGNIYSNNPATSFTSGTNEVIAVTAVIPNISQMTKLDSITIKNGNNELYEYGDEDLYTDSTGRLYLWIPDGCTVESVVIDSVTTNLNTSIVSVSLSYTQLTVGYNLNAVLETITAASYQWQQFNNTTGYWENITGSTSNSYTITASDIHKHLRVVITDDNSMTYMSNSVQIPPPTFTVTIPESITPSTATGSFNITCTRNNFTSLQSITVSCSGDFKLKLSGSTANRLSYTLYSDSQRTQTVASGTDIATFNGSGTNAKSFYYSITDTPIYAGTYTDTLTFTVSFNQP